MIDLLRARTAAHHHDLDTDLRIEERLSGLNSRRQLIAGYRRFISQCQVVLTPHLLEISDLTLSSRFRRRETKSEPARPGNPSFDPVLPAVGTKAEALGVMYVLEGSTLGGRVILKTLRSHRVSTDELHFLDPYGEDAGALWRTFLGVLERETAPDQAAMDACVFGAINTYLFAAICLRSAHIPDGP